MGNFLSEPVLTPVQKFVTGENEYLIWGCSSVQGYRMEMEDGHNFIGSVDLPFKTSTPQKLAYFAVYDGHSGTCAAHFCEQNLLNQIVKAEKEANHPGNEAKNLALDDGTLTKAFIQTDKDLLGVEREGSGTTAITTLVVCNQENDRASFNIIVPNVGDSRCVLCRSGDVIPMSADHKPTLEGERARIVKAGGVVNFGRVDNCLAVSRALGDFSFKQNSSLGPEAQEVVAVPDVKRFTLQQETEDSAEDSFLILACDGLWDVMSNEQAVGYVKAKLQEQRKAKREPVEPSQKVTTDDGNKNTATATPPHNTNPQNCEVDLVQICEQMIKHAITDLTSKDNVSAIIVLFKKKKSQ